MAVVAGTLALSLGITVAGPATTARATSTTVAISSAAAGVARGETSRTAELTTAPTVAVGGVAMATWWSKTVAFVGCIFSVGVPIGLAWYVATNPAWIAFFLRRGPLPPTAGGAAWNYWMWVRSVCSYALF
jgi:hypothetical protein